LNQQVLEYTLQPNNNHIADAEEGDSAYFDLSLRYFQLNILSKI